MSTITTQPTDPTSQTPGKSLTEHASDAWSGFTGMFKKKESPSPTTYMGGKSKSKRRSRSRKGGNPKKGMASKSRKGRKDFVTHKGDKYYNRKGHRQSRNAKGKRKSPYKKH